MTTLTTGIAILALTLCMTAHGQTGDDTQDRLWWDYPKISIVYGGVGGAKEPIDGLELLRLSGVTAVVGGVSSDATIRRAAEKGIHLIGLGYGWGIPHAIPSCRSAMNDKGQISTAACPFSQPFWEATIRKPVQIINRDHFRKHYPGSAIREYWLAVRSINRLLGIAVPENEHDALRYLRRIDD